MNFLRKRAFLFTSSAIRYICPRSGRRIGSITFADALTLRANIFPPSWPGRYAGPYHSSYVQQLAWLVWIHTDETATEQDFEGAYQDIIDQNTPLFEKQTESLTAYQMNFLRAVLEGVHWEFTTRGILQKYKCEHRKTGIIEERT
mgnify:CR=1 FL=1